MDLLLLVLLFAMRFLAFHALLALLVLPTLDATDHWPACATSVGAGKGHASSNTSVKVVSKCGGKWINAGYTDPDGNCDLVCNNQGATCVCTDLVQGNWVSGPPFDCLAQIHAIL